MTKVWYCRNCGYEVGSKGRCHQCREKLVVSDLPELEPGDDEDEVGYRLDSWGDEERGRLIEELNQLEILHRFEDDELVVGAEDESRVDDLLAELSGGGEKEDQPSPMVDAVPEVDDPLTGTLRMLSNAAARLRDDPTDMHADSDVAEASSAVFVAEGYAGADADTWSAVGRVTRRLLAVLGAEEALEDDIKREAGVLHKLLAPLLGDVELSSLPETHTDESEQTVYELPEWSAEQRAELALLLDDAGIEYEWEMDELIVPADRETEVEALFSRVGGVADDVEGGEERYQAVAELFAASGRLAADPTDEERAALVVHWITESQGPPLLGMNEVDWLMIMKQARTLSGAIDSEADADTVRDEASALHDILRKVV